MTVSSCLLETTVLHFSYDDVEGICCSSFISDFITIFKKLLHIDANAISIVIVISIFC